MQIAKEFDIATSTLPTILKSKDKILVRFTGDDNRKSSRDMDFSDVDEAVLRFFKQARVKNISKARLNTLLNQAKKIIEPKYFLKRVVILQMLFLIV